MRRDPLAELENVFASLKNPQPKELPQPAAEVRHPGRAAPAAPPPPRPSNGAERHDAGAAGRAAPAPTPDAAAAHADARRRRKIDDDFVAAAARMPSATRSYGPLLVAALVLAVLAGGGYGVWLNRDAFGGLFGMATAPQTAGGAGTRSRRPAEPRGAGAPRPARRGSTGRGRTSSRSG